MPTHYTGSTDEVQSLDCYIKLMRATESVNRILARVLEENGLTIGQLGVLELLLHKGSMIQGEIGHKMLRSDSNTCTVIENLEKQGLIDRARESEDRRRVRVSLTAAGKEKIARFFPLFAAKIADVFSTLEPKEQQNLARITRKLGLAAQEEALKCESKKMKKEFI